ncbi:MAG: DUF5657 family protein [Patescibacteria group bacterium]
MLDSPMITTALNYLFKIFFIAAGVLYLLFAGIIVRQINVMKSTLITQFSPIISSLGWLHLLAAVGVLGLYIFGL